MRIESHVKVTRHLEVRDRVRYIDFPVNSSGVRHVNRTRERVGTVIEVHPAVYSEPSHPGGLSWLVESDRAVVEFDDGTADTIEGAEFLLSLSYGPGVRLQQLVVL